MIDQKIRDEGAKEHYLKFEGAARALGINSLVPLVALVASTDRIKEALKDEENLNNIPLMLWDHQDYFVRQLAKTSPRKRWLENAFMIFQNYADPDILSGKSRIWSLSDTVCTLKHVAKYHVAGLAPLCEFTPKER